MPGNPIKFSGVPDAPFTAPPLIGQHTSDVLRDLLGYSDDRVAALRQAGSIQ
jgi:crotonobetainyl-CoA:carnitine CoA-transferase CaiB-like acyl-CoA transferase